MTIKALSRLQSLSAPAPNPELRSLRENLYKLNVKLDNLVGKKTDAASKERTRLNKELTLLRTKVKHLQKPA